MIHIVSTDSHLHPSHPLPDLPRQCLCVWGSACLPVTCMPLFPPHVRLQVSMLFLHPFQPPALFDVVCTESFLPNPWFSVARTYRLLKTACIFVHLTCATLQVLMSFSHPFWPPALFDVVCTDSFLPEIWFSPARPPAYETAASAPAAASPALTSPAATRQPSAGDGATAQAGLITFKASCKQCLLRTINSRE